MTNLILSQAAAAEGILNPVACLIRKFKILSPASSSLDDEVRKLNPPQSTYNIYDKKPEHTKQTSLQPSTKRYHEKITRKNNLIDSVKIASLKFGVHADAYDGSAIHDDIVIGIDSEESLYPPMDLGTPHPFKYKLFYNTGVEILEGYGTCATNSERHTITEKTESALVLIVGNQSNSEAENRKVCLYIMRLIRKSCPHAYGQIFPTITSRKHEY